MSDAPDSIETVLMPLRGLPQLRFEALGASESGGSNWSLPRFTFQGARGRDAIRIGIFAGIHGDEPAGTHALVEFLQLFSREPSLADDYLIHAYPICNPAGFARGTRENHLGADLNREFWKASTHPEVQVIERELREQHFQGLIQLHADDTSDGIYGFVRGHTLSENLLKPALAEAAKILPRNVNAQIDGFAAETPHHAPMEKQVEALVVAMRVVLDEYRRLIAFAADL